VRGFLVGLAVSGLGVGRDVLCFLVGLEVEEPDASRVVGRDVRGALVGLEVAGLDVGIRENVAGGVCDTTPTCLTAACGLVGERIGCHPVGVMKKISSASPKVGAVPSITSVSPTSSKDSDFGESLSGLALTEEEPSPPSIVSFSDMPSKSPEATPVDSSSIGFSSLSEGLGSAY